MTLEEIREEIDAIDLMARDLIMRRLDCSRMVSQAKAESGDTTVYRPERETSMLQKLAKGVPENRVNGYLAVVRKIIETSRMYQYGLIYEQNPEVFERLVKGLPPYGDTSSVTILVARKNRPGSMAAVLSMIGDYGFDLEELTTENIDEDQGEVIFRVTIRGNLQDKKMQQLMFQLSEECPQFRILKTQEGSL